jgi:hypothetical protein
MLARLPPKSTGDSEGRAEASRRPHFRRGDRLHQHKANKFGRGAMANPHPTRSRFSGGTRLPSRKARSTRALLILFGTPILMASKRVRVGHGPAFVVYNEGPISSPLSETVYSKSATKSLHLPRLRARRRIS